MFSTKRRFYLFLIFWIGFTSLMYEIYSTKVLFLFFTESSSAITLAITAFLAGLAFSSLFFSRITKGSTKNNLIIIFWMQLLVAIYAIFVLRQYDFIPRFIDTVLWENSSIAGVIKMICMWIYLFIPAFLIGGSFPLINGLYLESKEKGTQDTGIVYFFDTAGSILGAFFAGFIILPYFGFFWTCIITAAVNLYIAFILASSVKLRFITIGIAALSLMFLIAVNPNTSYQPTSLLTEYPELSKRFGTILFQKNSNYGIVTIGTNNETGKEDKTLFINYRDMCRSLHHESEAELGYLTTQYLPLESKVLNIGLGCGFTAQSIVQKENVSHVDIVEINSVVAQANKKFFAKDTNHLLESPKVTLHIQDGAQFIRITKNTYNAIVIDIEEPTIIYSSPLYTKEYFEYAHKKLQPDGILTLWGESGSPMFGKVIYNSLSAVFKYVSIKVTNNYLTYYASDSKYEFPPKDEEEKATIATILSMPITDINTMDNHILERYFNIYSFFKFPLNYKEPFFKTSN